ncbi:MAG: hypothetical protein V2A61_00875, partial [Calditrichota bacterium]
MNGKDKSLRKAVVGGGTILILVLLQTSALWARSDFDIHPRNLEGRIDGNRALRDTLWVDDYDGDEELVWSLEVVVDDASWISVTPTEGRVAAGREMRVFSVQWGPDLEPGHYYANIVFTTNDPTHPEFIVPVVGHTTEYPRITTGWPQPGWGEWWGIIMNNF